MMMNTTKSKTLAKMIREANEAHKAKVETMKRLAPAFAAAEAAVQFCALRPEWDARVRDWLVWDRDGEVASIRVTVDSFKDVMPLLEFLWSLGFAFDRTHDDPAYSTRQYFSPEGLMVEAKLTGAAAGCKRIITGYRPGYTAPPEPIYAFECDEAPPAE